MIPAVLRYLLLSSVLFFGEKTQAQTRLLLIAGQSNAVGQGDKRTSAKYNCKSCFDYSGKSDSLFALKDPVGQDDRFFNKASTGSIAPALAATLQALTKDSVIIVAAARGGASCHTKAELDAYGTWAENGRLLLFPAAVEKVKKAQAKTHAKLQGIIWLQGERDANTINAKQMTAQEYEQALKSVIARFRTEFGANLPFYIVPTGFYANHEKEGYDLVRSVQKSVAKELRNVSIIPVDPGDFPAKEWMVDDIHYSQPGLNKIGETAARQIAGVR